MYFWNKKNESSDIFIVSDDASVSYFEFNVIVNQFTSKFSDSYKRSLAFIVMDNSIESYAIYIACLKFKIIPLLLPNDISKENIANLCNNFYPSFVYQNNIDLKKDFSIIKNDELGLLLSTSGSTGSSKLVAISYDALQSNTESICSYLKISKKDRAFCSMPLSYSYGLSVLNTHFSKGASVVITNKSPFEPKFIEIFTLNKCTNISGVPFFHEALLRVGFYKKSYPYLRFITQAGGHLKDRYKTKIFEYSTNDNIDFFVMYGQTEATARISFVPPDKLSEKLSSIGIPIPNGSLSISEEGEIIYTGPNVMMGYVENFKEIDLLTTKKILHTGDLGYVDNDGFFFITGRAKRYIKIAGYRYSLDEIENLLNINFNCKLLVDGCEDCLEIFSMNTIKQDEINTVLKSEFNINKLNVKFYFVSEFPLNLNGKYDYKKLRDYICL